MILSDFHEKILPALTRTAIQFLYRYYEATKAFRGQAIARDVKRRIYPYISDPVSGTTFKFGFDCGVLAGPGRGR